MLSDSDRHEIMFMISQFLKANALPASVIPDVCRTTVDDLEPSRFEILKEVDLIKVE